MDPRLTPRNARVAHSSLRGQVEAARFTEGTRMRVERAIASLFAGGSDGGFAKTRELVLGEGFCVVEDRNGMSFGFAERDGYCGYMASDDLGPDTGPMTHVVRARQSYLSPVPALKQVESEQPISFGSRVRVIGLREGCRWAELDGGGYIPSAHLRPVGEVEADPVAVAERFLGAPYLWGGNSGLGIDCSGLVQAAFLACGMPCPGDSDLQSRAFGAPLEPGVEYKRGDLLFWKGHVALVCDADTLIHANAHHMAVAFEGTAEAIARIEDQGDGPVTAHVRI